MRFLVELQSNYFVNKIKKDALMWFDCLYYRGCSFLITTVLHLNSFFILPNYYFYYLDLPSAVALSPVEPLEMRRNSPFWFPSQSRNTQCGVHRSQN